MAIPVTNETNTALHAPVKQMRATISWQTSATETHTLTSEDKIISIKKEAEGYFCKSTLRKITIVLAGTDTNLLDQRVTVTPQVKTGANSWGDISWGSFTITEATVDEDKGISTFVGYGGIAMMQAKEYTAGELSFPTTVAGLAQQIADKFAIEIETATMALPLEYQAVEYLEGDGTAYITIPNQTAGWKTRIEAELEPLSVPVDSDHGQTGVYGEWTNGKTYRAYWNNSQSPTWSFAPGVGNIPVTLTRQKLTHDAKNGKITIDGNTRSFTPPTEWSVTKNFMIYRGDVGGNYYSANMRIYSFKIYNDDVIDKNLIPCYRKSDNTPGLYDAIGGTFYTNAGTGAFTVGADLANLPNYDAPIAEDLWAKISGTTYRDILEEIAGATGTIAVIGRGNDLLDFDLPPIAAASETLTENNLITAKIGEKWGEVSAVVLSRQPQGDNIEVIDATTAETKPKGKNWYNNEPTTGNMPGTTVTTSPDGWIINGTCTSEGARRFFGTATLPPGTYTIKVEYLSGSYATGSPSFWLYKGTGWDRPFTDNLGVTPESPVKTKTFTLEETTTLKLGDYSRNNSTYTDFAMRASIVQGTTPLAAFEPFTPNGRVDLVIANNEILDPQRETTAQPLLDAVKGWGYRNAEIKTEGHAYHEIGDRLDISVAGETYTTVVTKSTIQIDGGIKETLISTTPETIPIDYAKTGGITKTVFRTELAVDKQEQRIDAIVSRQDATDAAVQEQFTQVSQDLNSITATIQRSGGGNLIRNSVGFGKDTDGTLTIWEYGTGADTDTIKSQSSPASLNAGAVSGYEIMVTGAAAISQVVALTPGETYTLSARAQKASTGSATITIANSTNSATLEFPDQQASAWGKKSVEFTPVEGANIVTISGTAGTMIEITDLMLATGGTTTWRQASGEIYNTQVSLDQDGVRVSSSVYSGDYVEITPLEFAGWSTASGTKKKVFTLNRETTEVEKLEARSQLKMPPIKIVPINNSSYKGWAFVKEEN